MNIQIRRYLKTPAPGVDPCPRRLASFAEFTGPSGSAASMSDKLPYKVGEYRGDCPPRRLGSRPALVVSTDPRLVKAAASGLQDPLESLAWPRRCLGSGVQAPTRNGNRKRSRTTSPGVPRGRRPARQRGLRAVVRQRAPRGETGPWEAR